MEPDRRSEPRIPFVAPVTVYGGSEERQWQAQDLSLEGGGMFVASRTVLATGTSVEIGFRLPGYELEIVTDASVAWANDPGDPRHDETKPRGMGLTFNDLEPEFHKVLLQYVQQRKEIDDELALLELEVEGAAAQSAEPGQGEGGVPPTPGEAEPTRPPPPPLDADDSSDAAYNFGDDGSSFDVSFDPEADDSFLEEPASTRQAAATEAQPELDAEGLGPPQTPPPPPDAPVSLEDLVDKDDLPELPLEPPEEELGPLDLPMEDYPDLPDLPSGDASPGAPGPEGPGLIGEDGSLINDLIADSLAELDSSEGRDVEPSRPATPFSKVEAVAARRATQPVMAQDGEGERLDPGAILGSYRVVKWLGSGGMGDVYLAEHTQLGRKVAIKRLRSEYARNKRALQRFFDEARAVNRIQHENIVQITDFASEDEHVYCVMEFLEGCTLAELQREVGAVPLDQVLRIAIQVCDALEVVHKAGVIHRDLKPQNIMLIQQGVRNDCVKLLDFGVAKLKAPEGEAASLESTGSTLLGTPGYMSPEQLLGNPVDQRADIYALGVILYQMATGTNPFIADTWGQAVVKHATHMPPRPSELRGAQRLPEQLEDVILRCLEKDPGNRPSGVVEISLVLRQLTGVVAAGGDLGALASRRRPPRRRRGGLIIGIGLTGAIAAALVLVGPRIPGLQEKLPWGDLLPRVASERPPEAPEPSKPIASAARAVVASPATGAAEPQATTAKPDEATPAKPDDGRARTTNRKRAETKVAPAPSRPDPKPAAKAAPKPESAARAKPERHSPRATSVAEPAPRPVAPKPAAPKPAAPKPAAPKPVAPKPVAPKPAAPKPVEPPAAPVASGPTAETHYQAGRDLLKGNKALLAIEEFKAALKLNPRHAKSYRMMGKAYAMVGREEKAVEAFERAVKLAPNDKSTPKLQAIIDQYRSK